MKHLPILLLSAGFLLLPALQSSAQQATKENPFSPWYMQDYNEKWWRFELLLGLESEPTYPGSKEREEELGGLIRGVFKDKWNNRYTVTPDGVGGAFDITDDLVFDVEIEVEEGSEEEDTVPGLDDIEDTWEGQFTLAKRWGDTYAFGSLQPDLLDRGKGLVWFTGGGRDWKVNDRVNWNNALVLSGGDGTHMNTEFDITPEESERTGLDVYDPGSGVKTLAWVTGVEYKINKNFSAYVNADSELYLGDAADSPLVKDIGDDINIEALAGIYFRW